MARIVGVVFAEQLQKLHACAGGVDDLGAARVQLLSLPSEIVALRAQAAALAVGDRNGLGEREQAVVSGDDGGQRAQDGSLLVIERFEIGMLGSV
jgi:hypothetical protein